MAGPVKTSCININEGITYTTSQTPRENGIFYVKNKDKAPSDTNKKVRGFGSGNTVRREAFTGTSEALNGLQVKFDCGERNRGGDDFWNACE